jgi:hypothetical protein
MPAGYDLIGDIHGHLAPLETLLQRLGYERDGVGWRHPSRQAIFLGDFVDRGPEQRAVVNLARAMVERGAALAVIGNHEFNALAFHTDDPHQPGTLRRRSNRNIRNHLAFLHAYLASPEGEAELPEVLNWFHNLPLFLDLDGLRVVHACWDPHALAVLRPYLAAGNRLTPDLLVQACRTDTDVFRAVEILLKGKEIKLPDQHNFRDKDGVARQRIRIRWWEPGPHTYRSLFMGPASAEAHIPDEPVSTEYELAYGSEEPPVFVGHYWLDGEPAPLADNVACLDYSVARSGGKLVAYQWDGEQQLEPAKFVAVARAKTKDPSSEP